MSVENRPNTEISRDNVIEKLREKPQTFYDLLSEFGISKELNEKGRYCEKYLELLDIVSILETPMKLKNSTEKRKIVSCAKKENELSFVLYLTENEQNLISSGNVKDTSDQGKIFIKECSKSLKLSKQSEDTLFVQANR